jgi:hypothetical protein
MEPLHPSLSHKIYTFFFMQFLNEKFHVRFIKCEIKNNLHDRQGSDQGNAGMNSVITLL